VYLGALESHREGWADVFEVCDEEDGSAAEKCPLRVEARAHDHQQLTARRHLQLGMDCTLRMA
jgi:hypothetical protein